MKFIFSTILLSISCFASNITTQEMPLDKMQGQNKEIAKLAATELSKLLPQTIDKHTKLTKVEAQDATLIYIYEINAAPKSDAQIKQEDHSRMKEAITYGVCSSSQRFLKANIAIRYIYNSAQSKSELFHFDIDAKSCENLK